MPKEKKHDGDRTPDRKPDVPVKEILEQAVAQLNNNHVQIGKTFLEETDPEALGTDFRITWRFDCRGQRYTYTHAIASATVDCAAFDVASSVAEMFAKQLQNHGISPKGCIRV